MKGRPDGYYVDSAEGSKLAIHVGPLAGKDYALRIKKAVEDEFTPIDIVEVRNGESQIVG